MRDGFGCTFRCRYCYLQRFEHTHDGAELNPNVAGLYREVTAWLKRPGALGLLIGEVTDAWGWAKSTPFVLTQYLSRRGGNAGNVRLAEAEDGVLNAEDLWLVGGRVDDLAEVA